MYEHKLELIKVTKGNVNRLQVAVLSTLPVRYPPSFYRSIVSGSNIAYLAQLDGKCVGCIVWREEGGCSHLLALGVLVLHRRKGFGTALLNLFIKNCCSQEMYLHVSCDNLQGVLFYQKFGFNITEQVKNYYRGLANTHAVKMVKHIPQQ
jgi:ribosomal protein S18 acetylase RimI-like enzyme